MSRWVERTVVRFLQFVVVSALATVLLGGIVYVAVRYFKGWWILAAIEAEFALVGVGYHVFRSIQYPGLYRCLSPRERLRIVAYTALVMMVLPVLAILARFNLHRSFNFEEWEFDLGLRFRLRKYDQVVVSPSATPYMRLAERGEIERVHVMDEFDIRPGPPRPTGSISYDVLFPDGMVVEVPEEFLIRQ